jgi:glycine/D-amino acid oxidase-like deaminating enzyme
MKNYDICIIGAGFFGLRLALLFAKQGRKIIVLEREGTSFKRASTMNQARVHHGYHYPRSYATALSSRNHYKVFCEEYSDCIFSDYQNIYAIASNNSSTNSRQFEAFCQRIDIPLMDVDLKIRKLFSKEHIEEVYATDEVVFDGGKLRDRLISDLNKFSNVEIKFNISVQKMKINDDLVELRADNYLCRAHRVYNTTYAGINRLSKNSGFEEIELKFELSEVALIILPEQISGLGITVMDGQYFSTIPYPIDNCHSFTHVRYTPHVHWREDDVNVDAYEVGDKTHKSNWVYMRNDAKKYLPIIEDAKYLRSNFSIKTVVARNEENDGRPIVIKEHSRKPLILSILGSKIDNIYDLESYILSDKKND